MSDERTKIKFKVYQWLRDEMNQRGMTDHARALAFLYFGSDREVSQFDREVVREILEREAAVKGGE